MLIDVTPADLAGCRYAISPLVETTSAMWTLLGHDPGGILRPWRERMRPRLAELRAAEPAVGAWISLFRKDDNADFLHPPPAGLATIEEELARVRATPLPVARAELARNLAGHRTPPAYATKILESPSVVDRLADAIEATWSVLVAPEWPRLRAVLERDVVQRAGRLATYGWATALANLHPRVTWTASGQIAIRHRDPARYSLNGDGLVFGPSVFADLVLSTEPGRPFALIYRARGVADILGPPPVPAGEDTLGPLLGPARASLLRAVAAPATTSQLVAQLGLSLGGVGGHLAVLHKAGLVARTRTGRSVQYVTTPLGDALLRA